MSKFFLATMSVAACIVFSCSSNQGRNPASDGMSASADPEFHQDADHHHERPNRDGSERDGRHDRDHGRDDDGRDRHRDHWGDWDGRGERDWDRNRSDFREISCGNEDEPNSRGCFGALAIGCNFDDGSGMRFRYRNDIRWNDDRNKWMVRDKGIPCKGNVRVVSRRGGGEGRSCSTYDAPGTRECPGQRPRFCTFLDPRGPNNREGNPPLKMGAGEGMEYKRDGNRRNPNQGYWVVKINGESHPCVDDVVMERRHGGGGHGHGDDDDFGREGQRLIRIEINGRRDRDEEEVRGENLRDVKICAGRNGVFLEDFQVKFGNDKKQRLVNGQLLRRGQCTEWLRLEGDERRNIKKVIVTGSSRDGEAGLVVIGR